MKKTLLTALLMISSFGLAQKVITPTPEQCDNLSVLNVFGQYNIFYKTVAQFPNPSTTERLNAGSTLKCPDITIDYTNDYLKFAAKDTATLNKYLFKYSFEGIVLFHEDHWKYPALKMDLVTYDFILDNTGKVIDGVYKSSGLQGTVNAYFSDAVAGFRVNGGALQPFIYEMKNYPIPSLGDSDKLEIYIKDNEYALWQKVVFDKSNNTLEFYKKAEFPSK